MNKSQKLAAFMNELNSDFEESNFEENFNLVAAELGKLSPEARKAVASSLVQSNAARGNNGFVKHIGDNSNAASIMALVAASVGDLNLTVTRESANIAEPLPFVLFNKNDFDSGYISTITPLLPAGVTFAVTTDAATGDILFTYTSGLNVDIIRIQNLGNVPYRTFLSSMTSNYFATRYFLVSISDETFNLTQFAQPLLFGLLSALGLTKANQLVFRSRTNSWQYRKDRVEVVLPEQTIVPDFGFAMKIIDQADFSIGFDFFMSKRVNMNKSSE